jgi:hypothetical protein
MSCAQRGVNNIHRHADEAQNLVFKITFTLQPTLHQEDTGVYFPGAGT